MLDDALKYARNGWTVFPCKKNKAPLTKNGFHDATSDLEMIKKWWKQFPDAYIGIATGKQNDFFVIDIDVKNGAKGLASAQNLTERYGRLETRKAQTQSGGYHLYVKYPEHHEIGCCTNFMEGIDIRGDGGYVIAPGSPGYHWVEQWNEIECAPDALIAELAKLKRSKDNGRDGDTIPQGQRNACLTSLAGSMRRSQFSHEAIAAALKIVNIQRCTPPLEDSEVERIAESVSRYEPQESLQQKNTSKSSLIHVSEIQTRRIEYTIEDLVEHNAVGQVFGGYGTYKSFVTLDMALCVGTGKDFHGRTVKSGLSVYVCGEGHNGIAQRITAWSKRNGEDLTDSNVYLTTCAVPFLDQTSAENLREEIAEISTQKDEPVRFIVLDTLARNFGGDENSTRDMTRFLDNVNRFLREPFEASVLLVHHTGHQEKQRSRGAYALSAGVDFEYRAEKPEEFVLHVTCTKMKDAPAPDPITFQAETFSWNDAHQGSLNSLILVPLVGYDPPDAGKRLGKNQETMLAVLTKLYQQHRKNLSAGGANPDQAKVLGKDWREESIAQGVSRTGFYDTRDRLKERNLIEVDDPYVWPLNL